MKVKTKDLSGAALDWAVGKADGCDLAPVEYSTKWEFGGPIIERERIRIEWGQVADISGNPSRFRGWKSGWHADGEYFSDTPLLAAMRCYVAIKMGEEVDVPDCFFTV